MNAYYRRRIIGNFSIRVRQHVANAQESVSECSWAARATALAQPEHISLIAISYRSTVAPTLPDVRASARSTAPVSAKLWPFTVERRHEMHGVSEKGETFPRHPARVDVQHVVGNADNQHLLLRRITGKLLDRL